MELCSYAFRRAKKPHSCDVCGFEIVPGSEYISVKSMQDGKFWYNKEHIHCDAILNAYTKKTCGEIEWGEYNRVLEWIHDEACSECGCSSACRREGKEIFNCTKVLRTVLSPTILPSAIESVKRNIRI